MTSRCGEVLVPEENIVRLQSGNKDVMLKFNSGL